LRRQLQLQGRMLSETGESEGVRGWRTENKKEPKKEKTARGVHSPSESSSEPATKTSWNVKTQCGRGSVVYRMTQPTVRLFVQKGGRMTCGVRRKCNAHMILAGAHRKNTGRESRSRETNRVAGKRTRHAILGLGKAETVKERGTTIRYSFKLS